MIRDIKLVSRGTRTYIYYIKDVKELSSLISLIIYIYIYINHFFHRLTEQVNRLWTGFHKTRVLTENYLRTENSIIIIPTLLCGLYLCLHLLMISVRLFKISCLCSAIVSFLFTTDVLMEFSTIYQHFCFVLLVSRFDWKVQRRCVFSVFGLRIVIWT